MAHLAVLLPPWSVTPAGIILPGSIPDVPPADLLLTRVPDPVGALTTLLGQRIAQPTTVQRMQWTDTAWAATGILPSGGLCLLMVASPIGGVTDVLAAPVGNRAVSTEESGRSDAVLAAAIIEASNRGTLQVAAGDLAWLHPTLDPASARYFRR